MLQVGQRLAGGRYELVRFLRAGGAGVVWAARDLRPRRGEGADVAVKLLDASAGGADAARREEEVAARVRHPNVVRPRDSFVEGGIAGIVMNLACGSLADLVAREGPLRPPMALGCAIQICEGLAEAHRAGVVHRDVKPHNFLVFADGSVRLADFGAARALADEASRTRTHAVLGSLPFMAPEQRRDPRSVRPATDVYALSVSLAWLMLGEPPDEPWTPEAEAHLREAGVPSGLVDAIVRGGARRAEARPADGVVFLDVLRGCGVVPAPLTGGFVVDLAPGVPSLAGVPAQARGAGGNEVRFAWTGIGVIALAASLWWWASEQRPQRAGADVSPSSGETPVQDVARCPEALTNWVADRRMGPRETTNAAVAELDGDGAPEVLFTNLLDESVSVWWGHDPKRLAPQRVHVGRSFAVAASGDLDGNGRPVVVVARPDVADFAVVRRGADGVWAAPESRSQAPTPELVTIVDWDRDGHDDVVFRHRLGVSLRLDTLGEVPNLAAGRRHMDLARVDAGALLVTWRTPDGPAVLFDTPAGGVDELRAAAGGVHRTSVVSGSQWPTSRWLIGDLDGNGFDELYAASADGTLRRMRASDRPAAKPCVAASGLPYVPAALMPSRTGLAWSVVAFDSCSGCESNHVFLTGHALKERQRIWQT